MTNLSLFITKNQCYFDKNIIKVTHLITGFTFRDKVREKLTNSIYKKCES